MKKPFYKKGWFIITVIMVYVIVVIPYMASDLEDTANQDEAEALTQAEELGISEDMLIAIQTAYKEVGIDEVEDLVKVDGEDAYRITYNNYYITAYITDGGIVDSVKSGERVFWRDGSVIIQVDDVLVSDSEYSAITTKSKEVVTAKLKYPSTAEFPGTWWNEDQWDIIKLRTNYSVRSWGESQNSFGAIIRTNFRVTYKWDGSSETDPVVTNIIIG